MKKYSQYVGMLIIWGMILTGCNKYLAKEPDNRTTITTADQISQLLTNAYPQANYIPFCEAMTDNAEDKNTGSSGYPDLDKINNQAYHYQEIEGVPSITDYPDFYWVAAYKAIGQANQALETIDASANKANLTAQRGEALLARAYSHFMLVTLFSKAYDPTTAGSDPGIPYVTAPETVALAKYERKTVDYVYQMIEKDLTEGYPLINDKIYGTAPKFHFNKQAAAAFAARFYLFKQDYAKVISFATQALTGATADNLRPWNTTLVNLQYYDLQAIYTKADLKGNLLLQQANTIWGRSYPSVRYGMGPNLLNKISAATATGKKLAYPIYGAAGVYNIPKFYENFIKESLNATTGEPYNTIPLITAEEAVLNRAEAYIRTNNRQAGLDDINAFVSRNGQSYTASDNVTAQKAVDFYHTPSDTSGAIISTVLDMKRFFFMFEGMRWFDILRLKIPVSHVTSSGELISLAADDKRKVLQLPVITKQAGLAPNPR